MCSCYSKRKCENYNSPTHTTKVRKAVRRLRRQVTRMKQHLFFTFPHFTFTHLLNYFSVPLFIHFKVLQAENPQTKMF